MPAAAAVLLTLTLMAAGYGLIRLAKRRPRRQGLSGKVFPDFSPAPERPTRRDP